MESHFHDWINYNRVAHFWVFLGNTVLQLTVGKRTRMFVLSVKSKVFFIQFQKKKGSIHFRMTYLKDRYGRNINRKWLSWDRENYIFV